MKKLLFIISIFISVNLSAQNFDFLTRNGITKSMTVYDSATIAGLIAGKQPQLNGTGFVKATGTTISYDNSTYVTGNIYTADGTLSSDRTVSDGSHYWGVVGDGAQKDVMFTSGDSVSTLSVINGNAALYSSQLSGGRRSEIDVMKDSIRFNQNFGVYRFHNLTNRSPIAGDSMLMIGTDNQLRKSVIPAGGGGTTTNALSISAELSPTGATSFNGSAAKSLAIQAASVTNAMLAGSIDLTSKVTGILPAANGGTGNGFTAFTGPGTSTKTFTLPNASATILTDNAVVTVAQGGTGLGTLTANNLIIGNGTSTPNFLAPSTSGKIPVSNGTTFVMSTPTFPNASATSGKVIKSDGTNWVASTETYAAPGTSGNVMTSDGTNWTSAAPVVTASSTNTFTNKRWTARVGSTTSSGTPTINTDNVDIYKLTAQTADITSFTTNLIGTPVDGDILEIQVTGTAARAITWGSAFVSSTVTLPATTVTTATLTVIFQYFTTSSYGNNKWVCANSF